MTTPAKNIFSAIERLFWLDTRSLSIFRIGLGVVLLSSLLTLVPEFPALFTESGAFTQKIMLAGDRSSGGWRFLSLYFASDTHIWAYLLFAITLLSNTLFIAGLYTRWVTPVLWLLILSLHGRNPYILFGYDRVVLVSLFWSIFLPLNQHFSLQQRSPTAAPSKPTTIISLASVALITQIIMLYLHAAFGKYGFQWLEGRAVHIALNNDMYATNLGKAIRDIDWLTVPMNYSTLVVEALAPLLIISPWGGMLPRILGCGSLFVMHVGMALTMDLGWFPWACCALVLAPMPYPALEKIAQCLTSLLPHTLRRTLASIWNKALHPISTAALKLQQNQATIIRTTKQTILALGFTGSLILFTGTMARNSEWIPSWIDSVVTEVGLPQEWGFFAPNPRSLDQKIIIRGTFKDGSIWGLNLHGKEPLELQKTAGFYGMSIRIRDRNWREEVFEKDSPLSHHVSSYLCNKFKGDQVANEPKLLKIDVLNLQQRSDIDGKQLAETPKLIWYWNCD